MASEQCPQLHPEAEAPQPDVSLARRVNEIYHDLQAEQFNTVHRRRHRVERGFWQRKAATALARDRARFGVDFPGDGRLRQRARPAP